MGIQTNEVHLAPNGQVRNECTPYMTLIPVNNIDPEKFKRNDQVTIAKYWNKCFLQKSVSENIYNAIASQSGASQSLTASASICCLLLLIICYYVMAC